MQAFLAIGAGILYRVQETYIYVSAYYIDRSGKPLHQPYCCYCRCVTVFVAAAVAVSDAAAAAAAVLRHSMKAHMHTFPTRSPDGT